MNRNQFISTIMGLYPDTFKPENKKHFQNWVDRYKNAISEHWNFDKLMWYFDTQYKSTVIPPHPSFFYSFKSEVQPKQYYTPPQPLTDEEKKQSAIAFKMIKEKIKSLATQKSINL